MLEARGQAGLTGLRKCELSRTEREQETERERDSEFFRNWKQKRRLVADERKLLSCRHEKRSTVTPTRTKGPQKSHKTMRDTHKDGRWKSQRNENEQILESLSLLFLFHFHGVPFFRLLFLYFSRKFYAPVDIHFRDVLSDFCALKFNSTRGNSVKWKI